MQPDISVQYHDSCTIVCPNESGKCVAQIFVSQGQLDHVYGGEDWQQLSTSLHQGRITIGTTSIITLRGPKWKA